MLEPIMRPALSHAGSRRFCFQNNVSVEEAVMQRISLLLAALVVWFIGAVQAQAPAPKPDPEIQKMSLFVGHWKLEAEAKPAPVGSPPGKIKDEWFGQMTLGGFFFER